MDGKTLAGILREKYQGASRNEAACQVHLFGIQYAEVLRECPGLCGRSSRSRASAWGICPR